MRGRHVALDCQCKNPRKAAAQDTLRLYTYSDMGFYMMQHLAEKMLNQPIQDFLEQNIYEHIGVVTTGFCPTIRFPKRPDYLYRGRQAVQGSTLVGMCTTRARPCLGAAGHAGLFSNAE